MKVADIYPAVPDVNSLSVGDVVSFTSFSGERYRYLVSQLGPVYLDPNTVTRARVGLINLKTGGFWGESVEVRYVENISFSEARAILGETLVRFNEWIYEGRGTAA